ncbi:uncharacterized protein [Aegilops tauschii subsp. strangulata]|uniref:uncharacterized protein n=1 Tax=Aegilops tauschii subsp. strangulata TaxID=200361 RepID=UPI003CC871D1
MSPRCRGVSGCRGDRAPSDAFSAKIRSGDMRLSLDTFDTTHKAARAYDAAAWRLRRPRRDMNLSKVPTRELAQEPVPPPRLITDEDRHDNRRRQHRLSLA